MNSDNLIELTSCLILAELYADGDPDFMPERDVLLDRINQAHAVMAQLWAELGRREEAQA